MVSDFGRTTIGLAELVTGPQKPFAVCCSGLMKSSLLVVWMVVEKTIPFPASFPFLQQERQLLLFREAE